MSNERSTTTTSGKFKLYENFLADAKMLSDRIDIKINIKKGHKSFFFVQAIILTWYYSYNIFDISTLSSLLRSFTCLNEKKSIPN